MSTPVNPRTVAVALGPRSYDVVIGRDVLEAQIAGLANRFGRGRALIAADETVWHLHGARLQAALSGVGLAAQVHPIPPGEASKSFGRTEQLCAWLLDHELDRDEPVIAFGGGVVGDLAGFAAAIIKRGAPFVQIPTTLLAQVDSSVGGKTGINTPAGKNLVGAFHQPVAVIAEQAFLSTLDPRDMTAGIAEIAKIAAVADAALFAWLEANATALVAGEAQALIEAVAGSVAAKAAIVAADEREAGLRALLNFGHTFGHAFEAEANPADPPRHGEAVAAGMALAVAYARQHGHLNASDAERITVLLGRLGLPDPLTLAGGAYDPARLVARMGNDKKNLSGAIRLVLATGVGRATLVSAEDREALTGFLTHALTNAHMAASLAGSASQTDAP